MQNKNTTSLLFKLIRLGLDTEQDTEFPIFTEQEWMELVELGKRLAITGVMFSGIEKLPQERKPQKGILLGLIDQCLRIEKMNSIHNRKVAEVMFNPLSTKWLKGWFGVMKEKLGMEDRYMLMEPDGKAGGILIEEILTTGNFGFYDGRYKTDMGRGKRLMYRLKRRWMMVRYFGTEPLWDYYNRAFGKEEI